jgi:hypothetical protein
MIVYSNAILEFVLPSIIRVLCFFPVTDLTLPYLDLVHTNLFINHDSSLV